MIRPALRARPAGLRLLRRRWQIVELADDRGDRRYYQHATREGQRGDIALAVRIRLDDG